MTVVTSRKNTSAAVRCAWTAAISTAALIFGGLLGAASPAYAACSAIQVSVTSLATGLPLEGVHAISTSDGSGLEEVDAPASGIVSLPACGSVISLSKEGFATRIFRNVSSNIDVAMEPSFFSPMPISAGDVADIAADAKPGVFYAVLRSTNDVFRTTDSGATWMPVTMAYEDFGNGLPGGLTPGAIATSAVPGEVAIAYEYNMDNGIWFSTDYGISWKFIRERSVHVGERLVATRIWWLHSESENLILGSGQGEKGEDTAPEPDVTLDWWSADPTDPGAGVTHLSAEWPDWRTVHDVALINGEIVVAAIDDPDPNSSPANLTYSVVSAASLQVDLAPSSFLTIDGSAPTGTKVGIEDVTYGDSVASHVNAKAMDIGGSAGLSAIIAGEAVNGVAVSGLSPTGVTVSLIAAGTTEPSVSKSKFTCPSCGFELTPNEVTANIALAPTSAPEGNIGRWWFALADTEIIESPIDGLTAPQPSKFRFGSTWDADATALAFGRGEVRSMAIAADGSNAPVVQGLAMSGLRGAQVTGIATDPSKTHTAIALGYQGGNSKLIDAGSGLDAIDDSGANAVDWWQGTADEWLVFAADRQESGELLYGGTPGEFAALDSYITGDLTDLLSGGARALTATSIVGVPDKDAFFVAVTDRSTETPSNHLYRAVLDGTNWVTTEVDLGADPYAAQDLAYCMVTDKLYVAGGNNDQSFGATASFGGAYQVDSALTATAGALIAAVPHGDDGLGSEDLGPMDQQTSMLLRVSAVCGATDTVYFAGWGVLGEKPIDPMFVWAHVTGIYRYNSGTGDATNPTISQPDGFPVSRISAIAATTANDVTVADNNGSFFHSANGGTSWLNVYESARYKSLYVNDIVPAFAPVAAQSVPGSLSAASIRAAVAPEDSAIASNSGALIADLSGSNGLVTAAPLPDGSWQLSLLTDLEADAEPVLAGAELTDGPPTYLVAFCRTDGLYASSSGFAGWSLPAKISGTQAGDSSLAITYNQSQQKFWLTFARSGSGIFVTSADLGGPWSSPQKVAGSVAGDTLPTIASASGKTVVVFVRPNDGLFFSSSPAWAAATRVVGTDAKSADPNNGRPAMVATAAGFSLAFARIATAATKKTAAVPGGIRMTNLALAGSCWGTIRVVTTGVDKQPSIVATAGFVEIAFTRSGSSIYLATGTTAPAPKPRSGDKKSTPPRPAADALVWAIEPVKASGVAVSGFTPQVALYAPLPPEPPAEGETIPTYVQVVYQAQSGGIATAGRLLTGGAWNGTSISNGFDFAPSVAAVGVGSIAVVFDHSAS